MKFSTSAAILLSTLATSIVAPPPQSCTPDLLLDNFSRVITNNRNLAGGEYGDDSAPYVFFSGAGGRVEITAGTKAGGDNYWFFKNDVAECFDLRPYSHFEMDITAPIGSNCLITLTQKMPNCIDRGIDSTYHPLTEFTTPNGAKQTVRIPLTAFAQNTAGGNYDFQRLKDITFVGMKPAGAKFVIDNIKMIGKCTTSTATSAAATTATSVSSAAPSSTASGLGDWNSCTSSTMCASKCCSKEFSSSLKCHPAGSSQQCVGSLSDWTPCGASSECSSKCCSGEFSAGGALKCHPAGTSQMCKL